jgi:hypothetical protein
MMKVMSAREKSLRLKAVILGGCMEAATWLLWLWAVRSWPEHPEDTLPMMLLTFTQFPSILLVVLFVVLASAIHAIHLNPAFDSAIIVISYGTMTVMQAFLFAVYWYIMLYRPEKKGNR